MTDATMNLKTLIEKTPDADLLREMIESRVAAWVILAVFLCSVERRFSVPA